MRFLIAGLGSVGRRHLRNLVALGERNGEAHEILLYRTHQSTLPEVDIAGFQVVTDLDEALDLQPDGVIVSNPTALHLDVAIPAARRGCPLLLEKPISHSMARVEELADAVEQGGGQALVGFQFRFHPGLQQAARWLQDGEIGQPLSLRAVYAEYLPGMHPWEDYRVGYSARGDLGGGVILTLCHPLDYVRWLLGEVEAVWAFKDQLNEFELAVEDTAEIGLRFEQGQLGSVHLDFNRRPTEHSLEIVGSKGVLRWDNYDGSCAYYRGEDSSSPVEGQSGPGWVRYEPGPDFERNDMFLEEMAHFLGVARGECAPRCTLGDGIQALKLALAAHLSARENRLVRLIETGREGLL